MLNEDILHSAFLFYSYKQQFSVFRQCPHLVVYDQFQLVNVVTNLFQCRNDCIVVSDRFFAFAFDLVRHFSCFNHCIYVFFDEGGAVGDFFDQFQILADSLAALSAGNKDCIL